MECDQIRKRRIHRRRDPQHDHTLVERDIDLIEELTSRFELWISPTVETEFVHCGHYSIGLLTDLNILLEYGTFSHSIT